MMQFQPIKKGMKPRGKLGLVLGLSLSLLSACSSLPSKDEPTRFYSLSALAKPGHSVKAKGIKIGIGPVRLPRLLKRPHIVSRKASFEMDMSDEHQWAGTLKEDITSVLLENISRLSQSQFIERYPWQRSFKPNYQIRIDIEQFDGVLGQQLTLKSRWRLMNHLGVEQQVYPSKIVVNVQGKRYADYVAAQSQALATLAEQIVAHF